MVFSRMFGNIGGCCFSRQRKDLGNVIHSVRTRNNVVPANVTLESSTSTSSKQDSNSSLFVKDDASVASETSLWSYSVAIPSDVSVADETTDGDFYHCANPPAVAPPASMFAEFEKFNEEEPVLAAAADPPEIYKDRHGRVLYEV